MSELSSKLVCDRCGREIEVPREQKNKEVLCCGSPMRVKRA